MNDKDVVDRIQELCRERNWTYYRLAREANLPTSTLYNLNERTRIPTIPILQQICDALQITLSDFFMASNKGEIAADENELALLNAYEHLPKDEQEIFLRYAKGMARIAV